MVERRTYSGLAALVSLLGSVLYGRRPEDKRARKKVAASGAGAFLVWAGYQAVAFGQEWVRHEWFVQAETQREMVMTLKAMAGDVHLLTERLGDGGRR